MKNLLTITAFVVLLQGCASITGFTEENINRLRVGMLSTEIREMFGAPDRISSGVCGAATGNTWTCETWKYRKYGSYRTDDFTFSVKGEMKLLNNWDVSK